MFCAQNPMASKRRVRRKQCQHKKRHPDQQSARYHRFLLNQKDGEQMNVYKCRFCGGWHVGHQPRKRRKDFA